MVHRTDIAGGSVGRQALFVTACAAAPSSKTIFHPKLSFTQSSFKALSASRSGDKKYCRFTTAVPRDHAIYLELLTL